MNLLQSTTSDSKSYNEQFFNGVSVSRDIINPTEYINSTVIESYAVSENVEIKIIENTDSKEKYYVVNEPSLTDSETALYNRLKEKIGDELVYYNPDTMEDKSKEEIIEQKCREYVYTYEQANIVVEKVINVLSEYTPIQSVQGSGINESSFQKVVYFIIRDYVYYGKLTPLVVDKNIEDISCNGPNNPVYIYHKQYGDLMTNVAYEDQQLNSFVRSLAQKSGKHISKSNPEIDGNLPNGYRVQLTLGDEISEGSNFTIRRFNDEPLTPVDLIKYNTFSVEQMAFLWLAIENRSSLIFAGGTASGKTTSMNAVSLFIPPRKKIVTIEDTREIELPYSNWIKSTTRDSIAGKGEIGMYELLKNALRQRPEYIIVGEVRGDGAETLFQAMNTGHTTYSTFHADSVDQAINRFTERPINVPKNMIQGLDLMSIQQQTTVDNNRVRRSKTITEIEKLQTDSNTLEKQTLWEWDSNTDEFEKQYSDSYVLEKVRERNGWSVDKIQTELQKRETVLEYLVENNITGYEEVSTVIQRFRRSERLDSEENTVLEEVKQDALVVSENPADKYTELLQLGVQNANKVNERITIYE